MAIFQLNMIINIVKYVANIFLQNKDIEDTATRLTKNLTVKAVIRFFQQNNGLNIIFYTHT